MPLVLGLWFLCTWLTWVGLHVEVAAGGGRRGRTVAWAWARPLDHAALGRGGHGVAVAQG